MIDSREYSTEKIAIDSFGNKYSNVLILDGYGYIIYNLNNEFNNLELNISPSEHIGHYTGIITIKADGETIYTSPQISILTETINIDISLNNCKTLTIENNGDGYGDCIISDAILYN